MQNLLTLKQKKKTSETSPGGTSLEGLRWTDRVKGHLADDSVQGLGSSAAPVIELHQLLPCCSTISYKLVPQLETLLPDTVHSCSQVLLHQNLLRLCGDNLLLQLGNLDLQEDHNCSEQKSESQV